MKALFAKYKKPVVSILILAIVCVGGYFTYTKFFSKASAGSDSKEATAEVARGDLEVVISGTGTVTPISRYDIVPLVKGNILEAAFEEGQTVKAGDLLYKIDDSDLSFNISKSENGIEKQKVSNQESIKSINNLVVTAPSEGRLTNFTAKQGEQVSSSKIGDIVNDRKVIATVPFVKPEVDKIKAGQSAVIQAVSEWASAEGVVKSVSSAGTYSTDGSLTYNVEIEFDNTGTFVIEDTTTSVTQISGDEVTTGTTDVSATEVRATVKTGSGDVTSYYTGELAYASNTTVLAQSSGKVKQLYVKNGEWVKAGQKILELENDSLSNTVYKNSLDMKDSQLSLEAQRKQLNDYNITSPIDGTVIKKYFKAGDTISSGTTSTILMTVADITKMIFTISVDELDISKIEVGQKVAVTADALTDENLEGEVTNVSMEGTSSNGVTTYPVEVTIASPGKLKPGMNVNAEIEVQNKSDVLYVPVSAVTKSEGKSYVYVKSGTQATGGAKQQNSQSAMQNGQQAQARNNGGGTAGRQRVEVVTGINNDNYIEIVSGLNEGDVVYVPSTSSTTKTNTSQGMPGSGGGPGGGGGGMMGGPPPG